MESVTDDLGITGGSGWGQDLLTFASKGGPVDDLLRSVDPKAPMRAQEKAQAAALEGEQNALDYLMRTEELPLQYRDQGLAALGDYFLDGNQQRFYDQAMQSPAYQSMMQQGDDAILRNASATGGLRSGNTQQALAGNSQNVLNNLVQQQMQGISGLARTPLNTNQISNQMSGLGQQRGQGYLDAYGAQQQGLGSLIDTGTALYRAFSDIRLKQNIEHTAVDDKGTNWYSWDWNENAEKLGLKGSAYGVMAHEQDIDKLSVDDATGYLVVDSEKVLN